MSDYRWVKWRTRHAAGPGTWQYDEIDTEEWGSTPEAAVQNFIESVAERKNTFSEMYRGAEGDYENPPDDELEKILGWKVHEAERAMEQIVRWAAQLK